MSSTNQYEIKDVFTIGNTKLGSHVLTFSLPAIDTCPGSSEFCRSLCYATKGHFHQTNVQKRYKYNLEFSKKPEFVDIVSGLLEKVKVGTLLRIHVSGDFYDKQYTEKWYQILKKNYHIFAWCYTRSWSVKEIRPVLSKLAKLYNLQLWFSCDKETGQPTLKPKLIKSAYLMEDDNDIPSYTPDLYFRDYAARKTTMKHINGGLVCPVENGVTKNMTCEKCKVCFRSSPVPSFPTDIKVNNSRVSLDLVS